ncbi:unannotated protein [freshwater metagenome]|uniref:Unannotated protein n=1 Tax=freshwater metagenome TaxID=449393 RepID=A0A6J7HDZ0_9ZZZZ|nr:apolipoprotein N-acyltransferase [Actinomycetota bacterium]MSW62509.1 apolipoprotein N-acyltransferase [Actinomycetota bacterium]MSX89490.1 apolipoprotein N-acyltransferase [Actinomycetota bacterium]MSZ63833.1 apolipoprotein N-acyltransferase [Actinomycetota bacterium]MTA58307.1 apolipoprotein N-acyltransferase [Actinomycetota bacterium]
MVNTLLTVLAGALLSAGFAPLSLWWAVPIALALHMYCVNRCARPFLNVFIFAFTVNAIALHWTSIYVGSTPWIILAIGQGLLFTPLGLAKRFGIAYYPIFFIVLEEIRGQFPFGGFGWLRLAYTQADAPYRSIAAVGGAVALSATTLLIALCIFALSQSRLSFFPILPLLITLIPIHAQLQGSSNVLMIQGDVPQIGLDFNARATAVFFNHVAATKAALAEGGKVDFILWPENAVDVDPFTNTQVRATLDSFTYPMIIGAVIGSNGKLQNASIMWSKGGQEVYVKQHLTPFGEYIPLRSLAAEISPLAVSVEDFSPGTTSKIFTIKEARIAPVICFELLDDRLLSNAGKNSNLIVVQTNSATFGKSPESLQQLAISRVRAIEHQRNILSVSTTGVSAVIDYKGNVDNQTRMHESAHIFTSTALINSQSPRDRAGNWALVGVLIWLLIICAGPLRRYY